MKEAFDTFFEEMDRNNMKELGTLPTVPCREGALILPETCDKYGYSVWRPQLQTETFSFDDIEKELGFKIHSQLKDYLTTYWFWRLRSRMEIEGHDIRPTLDAILPGTNFNEWLRCMRSSGETHYLRDHVYFLLGTYCKVDLLDNYLVEFNNDTGEVTAVGVSDRVSIRLAGSIEELLKTMKGRWMEK
jgi:hypothetical protein